MIHKLQDFEFKLLEKARDEYEFINPIEYQHLARIKEDRNASAHPAFMDTEQLFEPTGEIARTHIVHAIRYLLQYQPTQGKMGFALIVRDLKRATFPQTYAEVKNYAATRLAKAKEKLISDLTVGLIKGVLNGDPAKDGTERNVTRLLRAIAELYHDIFYDQVKNKLKPTTQIEKLEDDHLWRVLALLVDLPLLWGYIDETTQNRLRNFLSLMHQNTEAFLPRYATLRALKLPELQEALTPYHEAVHIEIEKALDSYQRVTTDNRALEVGQQEILPLVDYFEAQHVQGFVQAIVHNQSKVIIKTYQSEPIIEEVFVKTAHLLDECRASWQQLLTTLGSQNLYGGYKSLQTKIRQKLK